jgi:hypothetical protein
MIDTYDRCTSQACYFPVGLILYSRQPYDHSHQLLVNEQIWVHDVADQGPSVVIITSEPRRWFSLHRKRWDDSNHASDRVQCGNDLVGEAASAVPGIVEDDQAAARSPSSTACTANRNGRITRSHYDAYPVSFLGAPSQHDWRTGELGHYRTADPSSETQPGCFDPNEPTQSYLALRPFEPEGSGVSGSSGATVIDPLLVVLFWEVFVDDKLN